MSTPEQPANDTQVTTTPAAPPAPATGVQPADGAPAAADERIPLPAPKPAIDPEVLRRRARGLDAVLVGVLLIFAFVTASFKATNSDLFMHLATGRLIVQGAFEWGVDPYTFGSTGRWVEHAWLYDVILYGL